MMETTMQKQEGEALEQATSLVEEQAIDSVTLARLIEEVRNEGTKVERRYDRTHNRHNR